jgi:hypothetical protein
VNQEIVVYSRPESLEQRIQRHEAVVMDQLEHLTNLIKAKIYGHS